MAVGNSLVEDLYNQSKCFSSPIVKNIPNFIKKFTIKELHKLLIRIKDDSLACHRDRIRLYVDNKRKKPFGEKAFLADLPDPNMDLNKWLEGYFDKKDFLLFINYSGSWSNELATLLADFSAPLLEKFSPFSLSLESHIIIGRYKTTPFGVHIDDPNDRVIHFNLSDNEKYLHLWDKEKYRELTGSFEYIENMNDIQEYKTTYTIKKNDAFVLPAAFYHVGESPKISIIFALALTKISKKDLILKIVDEMKDDLIKSISSDIDYAHFEDEEVLKGVLEEEFLTVNKSFNDHFSTSLKKYKAKVKSNRCFVEKPLIIKKEISIELNENTIFTKIKPFNIEFFVINNKIYLYARGHKFSCKEHPSIIKFIEYLKKEDTFLFKELLKIDEVLNHAFVDKLVRWLVSTSAFKLSSGI
ncbi:MAG: hypothetical protein K2X02_09425 [Alphaproteobacteria bacterium]|nr:hypothetical protein [Alphaproteobacteria bacterium]